MTRPLIGTVVTKNYLPFARVLARSLLRHHPECRLVFALADETDASVVSARDPFWLLMPSALGVPDVRELAFRTTQREFAITLKPYLLARLLEEAESALFLDPDVLVLGNLDELFDRVHCHALTLVPHALVPPSTPDRVDRDLVLNRAGAFNAGVVGVRSDDAARRFLSWWQRRVHSLCVYAADRGVHYDQRWLDLALGFVQDLHVHRDVGVNVAHWNLFERPLRIRNGCITVAGNPCRLFHFSGFDPDRPELPTRHRPDLRFDELGDVEQLFRDYATALNDSGWREARDSPYAYATFDNGVAIPEAARRLYAEQPDPASFGDPFVTGGRDSYFRWLTASEDSRPNHLWLFIHRTRPDLQRAFPDPLGADRAAYLRWARRHGVAEHGVPSELT